MRGYAMQFMLGSEVIGRNHSRVRTGAVRIVISLSSLVLRFLLLCVSSATNFRPLPAMEGITSSDMSELNGAGTKRGSEDMLYQRPVNGTSTTNVLSTIHRDDMSLIENEAKKAKLDNRITGPSKVVHIRNLSNDTSEAEVVNLGVPFGEVTNLLMLKGKNQALIELANEVIAARMVEYYGAVSVNLRGRPVYVQYSNHKELKTNSACAQQAVAVQAALQAVNAVLNSSSKPGSGGGGGDNNSLDHVQSGSSPQHSPSLDRNAISQAAAKAALQAANSIIPNFGISPAKTMETEGGPNHVLHASIDNCIIPVTIEALHKVFSPFGTVLKIVTFTRNGQFQALIQLQDATSAATAKMALDNQNIYTGCCTLRIVFSKLQALSIKYNNDKSRDFTRPDLPYGDRLNPLDPSGALALRSASRMPGAGGAVSMFPHIMHPGFAGLTPAHTALTAAAAGFPGHATAVPGVANAFPTMTQPMMASQFPQHISTVPVTGTAVLLVSNLSPELVTPQDLFTLFGVYGDVVRVKILYEKRDNALIQMADPIQASICMQHLNGIKMFGKQLRVAPSKHQLVQMPKEGQPDAGLTKDFTNSPLHRFKKPGSKNFQNIYPPSAVLHLSNIPPTTTEEELKSAFAQHGTVIAFKFFPKDRKMALIQMNSVEEAVQSLITLHNYQLSETNHLRVSFSKATITPGT
ncbi:Polypyrimidine tract-binding protein 2 [Holothuria leucospilota]|uniref:Polypyrimidine tract-binding protein 2 n=1 Tax=Holothuria leucospilota TaxID=206669 RepID=A0A9Q1C918_HOLLE|nr:Polypyrimidine tract-binding protein 2 [Holothuria leucospilota]